jgi:hypothetical protein
VLGREHRKPAELAPDREPLDGRDSGAPGPHGDPLKEPVNTGSNTGRAQYGPDTQGEREQLEERDDAGEPSARGVDAGRAGVGDRDRAGVMIPSRSHRSRVETFLMRIIATAGIIGIGVAIAAIMGSQHSRGWLIGLVVSIVSVLLAGILWSSRRL